MSPRVGGGLVGVPSPFPFPFPFSSPSPFFFSESNFIFAIIYYKHIFYIQSFPKYDHMPLHIYVSPMRKTYKIDIKHKLRIVISI